MIIAAIALDLIVLAFFLVDTARNKPRVFLSMLVVFALTVVFDVWWKALRDKPASQVQPDSPTPLTRTRTVLDVGWFHRHGAPRLAPATSRLVSEPECRVRSAHGDHGIRGRDRHVGHRVVDLGRQWPDGAVEAGVAFWVDL